jgi:hypothetical protein
LADGSDYSHSDFRLMAGGSRSGYSGFPDLAPDFRAVAPLADDTPAVHFVAGDGLPFGRLPETASPVALTPGFHVAPPRMATLPQ